MMDQSELMPNVEHLLKKLPVAPSIPLKQVIKLSNVAPEMNN